MRSFSLRQSRLYLWIQRAAGAAFTAAMVNGLAQEMGMIQAIRMANGVASIVVTRHGAQASIPDRDEIDDLIWNY